MVNAGRRSICRQLAGVAAVSLVAPLASARSPRRINVLDHRASGDDPALVDGAVRRALGQLVPGDTLWFPAGHRYVLTQLRLHSLHGFIIEVDGELVSAAPDTGAAPGADARDGHQGRAALIAVSNCANWKIRGKGRLDNRFREAFWIEDCTDFGWSLDVEGAGLNHSLEGARIRRCSRFQLSAMSLVKATAKPSQGYRTHANALVVMESDHFQIDDVRSADNGMNGLYIASGCSDFTVSGGSYERNAGSGLQLAYMSMVPRGRGHGDDSAFFPIRWTLEGVRTAFNRADGFDINNTYPSRIACMGKIADCRHRHNGWTTEADAGGEPTQDGSGLATLRNVSDIAIHRCDAAEPARAGLYIADCTRITVTASTVVKTRAGTRAEGVYVTRSDQIALSECRLQVSPALEALSVQPDGVPVRITMSHCDLAGIVSFAQGVYAAGSLVSDCILKTGRQIECHFDWTRCRVEVFGPKVGLYVAADAVVLADNTVEAGGHAIVSTQRRNVRLTGNRATGGAGGIRIDSDIGAVLEQNQAICTGDGPGIEVLGESQHCRLIGNSAGSARGISIRVRESCKGTVQSGNRAISGRAPEYAGTYQTGTLLSRPILLRDRDERPGVG